MIKKNSNKHYWRSLESLNPDEGMQADMHNEFPEGASEDDGFTPSRRDFMGLMGAGMAIAGAAVTGCVRKPQEHIYAYTNRPENTIPGKPKHYATSTEVAGVVTAFLVESHDGRPTKIEGNPDHPASGGAASARDQASILDLYDMDRLRAPIHKGAASSMKDFDAWLTEQAASYTSSEGAGLAVLVGHRASPTTQRLLGELKTAYPKATLYRHDEADRTNARAGAELSGVKGALPNFKIENASVMIAADSDFLGSEGDTVAHTRGFSAGRRVVKPGDVMNRLYSVEPTFSITGSMADHRLRCSSTDIAGFLAALVGDLKKQGVSIDVEDSALAKIKGSHHFDEKWVHAAAKDLKDAGKKALVLVGERQPAHLHALANAINDALGAIGSTVEFVEETARAEAGTLADLTAALNGGSVKSLFVVGNNPVYNAPVELDFAKAIEKAGTVVVHGSHNDETATKAEWVVSSSHYLESWGDWQATDGTVSLQQPLIAPLFDTISENEMLARLTGNASNSHTLLKAGWSSLDMAGWRKALHSGVATTSKGGVDVNVSSAELNKSLGGLAAPAKISADNLEINFILDPKLHDGRFANNGWLQELPDPMTKLTWDNAILVNVAGADVLGIKPEPKKTGEKSFPMAEISFDGRSLEMPVFITPGLADNVVVLSLGYGRTGGAVADGAGFNVNALRTAAASAFGTGVKVKKIGGRYKLACTQDHWYMGPDVDENKNFKSYDHETDPRPIVLETTRDSYKKNHEHFVHDNQTHHPELTNLWDDVVDYSKGQQWGMSIDLTSCTGCNACTIACQSENNIPVVGKDRVMRGREMHWIRLDRYYTGDQHDPEAVHQPMACAHCEMAPCESVCPVAATSHTPDGLNDMAYNRCIGTRYCSNNCPYKVRRFNYFAYNFTTPPKENFWDDYKKLKPIEKMQKNPDVTVRFRGVMEKCTYCVQRIMEAKIHAKAKGNGVVPDGGITPACEQTCPAGAIVFGDQNDPESRVSILKKQERDYALLEELNLRPRTTFLAKLRNPNPALAGAAPEKSHHG